VEETAVLSFLAVWIADDFLELDGREV